MRTGDGYSDGYLCSVLFLDVFSYILFSESVAHSMSAMIVVSFNSERWNCIHGMYVLERHIYRAYFIILCPWA